MKEIALTKGYVTKVDDDMFEELSQYHWVAGVNPDGRVYAKRSGGPRGTSHVFMHRQIMNVSDPKIHVDHRNGEGLDNQRHNLRTATKSQNAMNRGVDKRSTSGYKGVSWSKVVRKWRAYIVVNGQQKQLGYFDEAIDGAKAYDAAAIELHGEFAYLNLKAQAGLNSALAAKSAATNNYNNLKAALGQ